MSTLYLVATPIGNLEDITLRAVRVLREVTLIAAEDTRQTVKLLNHYQITTKVTSYHEHNKIKKLDMILHQLEQGDVALVSDAGTPLLNDPGFELVQKAIDYGYIISPIPGASAPIAALSCSGISPDKFLYLGYLPRKKNERLRALESVATLPYTLIFLEAPHRLLQSLKDIQTVLGDRNISIARELTKIHEEILRGKCTELIKHFSVHDPRGEFTLVISGVPVREIWTLEQVNATTQKLLEQNKTVAEIARELSSLSGWSRRKVYQLIIQNNSDTPERGER